MADASGTTPLHLACRRGYSTVAFMLARRGASPVLAAGKRGTPIDEARRGGYKDLADELVSMPQVAAFQY
jgi:ankyrin repeat protein